MSKEYTDRHLKPLVNPPITDYNRFVVTLKYPIKLPLASFAYMVDAVNYGISMSVPFVVFHKGELILEVGNK